MEEFLQNRTCIAFNYIDTDLDLIFCFEVEICYSGNLPRGGGGALGKFWVGVFPPKIEKRPFSTADAGPKYDPCLRKFYKNSTL